MDFRPYADPENDAIDQYRAEINRAATAAKVPACALAALVEIESGGRNILQEGIGAGPGCGVGLCQITFGVDWTNAAAPTYNGAQLLEPAENLGVAARSFLRPAIDGATALRITNGPFMNGLSESILYFSFSAYNVGLAVVADAIAANIDPDEFTTNRYASRAYAIYVRNLKRSEPVRA